uniref:Uncharacterized protein n=1 Tax=Setaria italica TaxID=4555 RepID=K4AND8_SETIT
MEQNLQWCPTFNNLTTLTLGGWCRYKDFDPLIVFLWNSPNLEQFTLELSKNMMVYSCFCPHVHYSLYES